MVDADRFPKPFPLSEVRVAWFEDDIIAWQADLTKDA
jgi:predicted DNA-binding transcriptional regulator AlpA